MCICQGMYEYSSIYSILVQHSIAFSYTKKFDKYIYIYNIPRKFLFLFQLHLWSATLSKKKVRPTRNSFSATKKRSSRLVLRTNSATQRRILVSSHTARSVRKRLSVSTTELLPNNRWHQNIKNPFISEGIFDTVFGLIRTSGERPGTESDNCCIDIYVVAHTITTGSRSQDSRECGSCSYWNTHYRDSRTDDSLHTCIPCLRDSCNTRFWESSPCCCLLECPEWLRPLGHERCQWGGSWDGNHYTCSNWYERSHDWGWLERIRAAREESERDDSQSSCDDFLHSWEVENIPTWQLYAIVIEMQGQQLYCIKWLFLKYPCSQTEYDRRIYDWEGECDKICFDIYGCCRRDEIFEIEWF